MIAVNDGPSDNAWGVELTDPVLVKHQTRLVLVARERGVATGTLYFSVLDPSTASEGDDLAAWNGWYRYRFPEVVAAELPQNAEEAAEVPARELRLAGMDLITVPPLAEPVEAADAAFRVSSDGTFLVVQRQSSGGTLLIDRVGLLSRSEDVEGQTIERYALEPAWEVRFRRSGLRDVPLDDTDTESYLDPVGEPFYEPTIELGHVTGVAGGAFDVARVPTSVPEVNVLYAAVATSTGVQLHQVRQTTQGLNDYTETPVVYPPIRPTLRNGGTVLTPVAGLAPALVFWAEQEAASTSAGEEAELQRAGHLMLAIPVEGGGLGAATAIYDFALDRDGNIPVLPESAQSLVLVDGTLSGGKFTPNTTAPAYPTPAELPDTVQIVDGLLVSTMVLGQVQPTRSPLLHFGDDGLVHLYFGGPLPKPPFDRWSSLDPTLPQALVAQFDARANRLVVSVPWKPAETDEQGDGAVKFWALQSGCIMEGATVAVSDGALSGGAAQADLCDVAITYPKASGLPAETWRAVPRSLGPFMDVLNGQASDDSADPAVLSGTKPYYDFTGTRAVARPPLRLPAGVDAGPPPVVTLVSARPDLPLHSVVVSASGAAQDWALEFETPEQTTIAVTWRGVPSEPAAYGDLFDGAAAPATYAYPADVGGTALFGLRTDARGVPAPVLFYALGTHAVADLEIEVVPSAGTPGALDVTFTTGGTPVPVHGVPRDVEHFVATLKANAGFQGLGLGISGSTAGGNVLPTPVPAGRAGLAASAVLFDVLLPAIDLTGAAVETGTYAAGFQGHVFDPASELDPSRMAGFLAGSLRPSTGVTAYVQNTKTHAARSAPSRSLHAHAGADPLVSGVWVRPPVQQQCSFAATENVTVPVLEHGAVLPRSANLRPQWDWTVETWIRPEAGKHQRLLTFRDAETPIAEGAPELAWAVALENQQVVQGKSYPKHPGTPDSSYFQSGTSTKAEFMPAAEFTWEVWVKPDEKAAPPPKSGVTPIGGLVQVGSAGRTPFLTMGLTEDRHVYVVTLDESSTTHVWKSSETVPAVDDSGLPAWSHLALIGAQDATSGKWTLSLMLDAGIVDTFDGVELQKQSGAFLVIGANSPDDATLFGSMAQLRYWAIARSAADIRRTWLTSMSGTEPGLLGNWPLTRIEPGGGTGKLVRNTAAVTGADWDASLFAYDQPLDVEDDSFFLSVVASVGGLPAVEADALLANDRWNHLAIVYRAGGALDMNSPARFQSGRYDWVSCGHADGIVAGGEFAIDAWLRVEPKLLGELGTIMARWAPDLNPDDQRFKYWIDAAGEMHLSVAVVVDDVGTVEVKTAQSSGAALADGVTHHVAVVFASRRVSGDPTSAEWTITFYKDGKAVGTESETIADLASIDVRTAQTDVTIGALFGPVAGAAPMAAEDFYYLRAKIGEVRVWSTAPTVEALFPEEHPRIPQAGTPRGLAARWSFREQSGLIALDAIGDVEAKLSSSAMWSSLADTSTLTFVANGAWVGNVAPADAPLEVVQQSQFTIGKPGGGPAITGFTGTIAQVSFFDEARSVEEIQDQMYVPRRGAEAGLVACWNFSEGGADITGGRNDADPPVPAARLSASTAPMSNEGPYVRNVYGGLVTDLSQSAPGRIAVGSYADASNVGTARQRAALKRQYVVDPDQTLARAVQIGELELTYVGQVQTDPTLIGYIEGAPPVPSENLTRPYYLKPDNTGYMKYLDTATVALVQEAAETLTFTSSSSHATQIEAGAAIGLLGIRNATDLNLGAGPFSVITNSLDARGIAQAVVKGSGEIGGGDEERLQAVFGATQRDRMGVNGDWEPYQADPAHYLDPAVGRRFAVDNGGYALVESLTADLYAITFGPTRASLGTIVLPNPAIPPDRNVIVFPMNVEYTRNGTLDGKIGLTNDPAWPQADIRRGSYFQPVEAYALAARIERERERSASVAKQFDPGRRAHGWDTSLDDARGALSQDFSETPADAVAVATPVQGLANRYVWTADGGFHAEEQTTGATSTRSYAGNVARGGGGGFHADGEFFIKLGVAWSFDVMATHRVDVSVSKETGSEQSLRLEVEVEGEAFLEAFDPTAPGEYGGQGAYLPGAAPGKVKAYRFMTIYLPPSSRNSVDFARIVDPVWMQLSTDAAARALRQLDASSPTWRVLHRVTYVERVPPPLASRPVFTPATSVVAPVNPEGNAELIRLVAAQIPAGVTERTRLVVGRAVAATLDPAPTAPGVYPPSALEHLVPWWRTFLDRARPGASTPPPDPAAAKLLQELVARTTTYMFDGWAAGAFDEILAGVAATPKRAGRSSCASVELAPAAPRPRRRDTAGSSDSLQPSGPR